MLTYIRASKFALLYMPASGCHNSFSVYAYIRVPKIQLSVRLYYTLQ